MPRLTACALLLAASLFAGCDDDSNLIATPINPTPEPTTETFSGRVARNGGVTHTFVTNSFGSVQVILIALSWDAEAAPAIGMSLGTWNGTSCAAVISQDRALLNASILGTANQAGTYCVRAYDADGQLERPVDYSILVNHP
jgi:hypothetical protein